MPDPLLTLLATIERLDAAATPGPWEWLDGYLRGAHLHFGCSDGCTGGDPDDRSFVIDGDNIKPGDRDFLASTRMLAPALASMLRVAVEALEWYARPETHQRRDHYSSPSQDFPAWTEDSDGMRDGGARARAALATIRRMAEEVERG